MRINMYPAVTKVIPRENYQIYVEFDNDESGLLDMQPYLNFGVFSKIQAKSEFEKVRVVFDTVQWGNGIDLDPQFVYEKSIKGVDSTGS